MLPRAKTKHLRMRVRHWNEKVYRPIDREFLKGFKIGYEIGAEKAWHEAREILKKRIENTGR